MRTYPIAYNKWIQEQLVDMLQLPEVYRQLTHLFELKNFKGGQLLDKARQVEHLLQTYAPVGQDSANIPGR